VGPVSTAMFQKFLLRRQVEDKLKTSWGQIEGKLYVESVKRLQIKNCVQMLKNSFQIITMTFLHQSLCSHQDERDASYKGHQEWKKFESSIVDDVLQIKAHQDWSQYNLYDHESKDHGCQNITTVAQSVGTKIEE
jgi:hypothetical protein